MKIGMTFVPFKGVSLPRILSLLQIVGLEHLEINPTIMGKAEEFKSGIKNMDTTFHLPIYCRYHYDFSSTNSEFQKPIDEIISFLNDYKKQLNLKFVLTHPPEDPLSDVEILIDRLESINSPILIENIPGQTDKDFMNFYFKVKDRLGKKLNGHTIDGPHRYVNNPDDWLNIPKELLNEISYVHISDCTINADLHLPLGCGKLPYNDFFTLLKEIKFNGVIINEIIPSFDIITSVLDSILYSVKPFSKRKYFMMKTKFAILKPIAQLKVKTTYKQLLKKEYNLLLQDFVLDLGL